VPGHLARAMARGAADTAQLLMLPSTLAQKGGQFNKSTAKSEIEWKIYHAQKYANTGLHSQVGHLPRHVLLLKVSLE